MPGISTIAERTKNGYLVMDDQYIINDESLNEREDYGDEEELELMKASILNNGIFQQILGRMNEEGTHFIVEDGFRRTRLYKELIAEGKTPAKLGIPIKINETEDTPENKIYTFLETSTGKKPTLIERGKCYKKLQDLGHSLEEIGNRIGVSSMAIHNALAAYELPSDIKEFIKRGELSPTEAVLTVKREKENAIEVIEKARELATIEHIEAGKPEEAKVKITGRHTKAAKPFASNPEIFEPDPTEKLAEDIEREGFISMIKNADLEEDINWEKVTTKALEIFYRAIK